MCHSCLQYPCSSTCVKQGLPVFSLERGVDLSISLDISLTTPPLDITPVNYDETRLPIIENKPLVQIDTAR